MKVTYKILKVANGNYNLYAYLIEQGIVQPQFVGSFSGKEEAKCCKMILDAYNRYK